MNPLTGLYAGITALRNGLFNRGTLASRRLDRPVVSVGNLSVGGSGKTPFVIALGELLKARGIPFDVLSRGYGRKTHGVMVVDAKGSAANFGDEPLDSFQAGVAGDRNLKFGGAQPFAFGGILFRCRSHPGMIVLQLFFESEADID